MTPAGAEPRASRPGPADTQHMALTEPPCSCDFATKRGRALDGLRGRGQEGPEEGSEVLRGSEARERGGGGGGSGGSAHYVWGQTREKWKEERGWLKAEERRQETS